MNDETKKFTRDKESKIELIIDTMTEIIGEKGIEKASVRDIPKRANLSIGTVYRYFPRGKLDILQEMGNRNMDTVLNVAVPDEMDTAAFWRVWLSIIDVTLKARRSNMYMGDVLLSMQKTDPATYQEFITKSMEFCRMLARRFIQLDDYKSCSESELIRRIIILLNLIDRVINLNLMNQVFEDDDYMVAYLRRIIEVTFITCPA